MRSICVTEVDLERLRELVLVARSCSELDQVSLSGLQRELDRASIISAQAVPSEVITMHSHVRIRDVETSEEREFTLVYPRGADLEQGRISVMAPLGTALLGCVGDIIESPLPDGSMRHLKIIAVVYQPEAAGHFHL
jgi:regulator of nucleoside diphosphate kinase